MRRRAGTVGEAGVVGAARLPQAAFTVITVEVSGAPGVSRCASARSARGAGAAAVKGAAGRSGIAYQERVFVAGVNRYLVVSGRGGEKTECSMVVNGSCPR